MKTDLIKDMKNKYKDYRIDDKIDDIVNNIIEGELNIKNINKKYKKPVKKIEIEDDPINHDKCIARKLNGGYGGQCSRYRLKGSKYCKNHQTAEQRWCGLVTEKRQEICYYKGNPHKWKN